MGTALRCIEVNDLSGLTLTTTLAGGCRDGWTKLPRQDDLHTARFNPTPPDIVRLQFDRSDIPFEPGVFLLPPLLLDQSIDVTSLQPVEVGQLIHYLLPLLLSLDLVEKGPLTDRERDPVGLDPRLLLAQHLGLSLAEGEAFVCHRWTSVERGETVRLLVVAGRLGTARRVVVGLESRVWHHVHLREIVVQVDDLWSRARMCRAREDGRRRWNWRPVHGAGNVHDSKTRNEKKRRQSVKQDG